MKKDYIKTIDGAERRYFDSEVRSEKRAEDDVNIIEGYAAKFNSAAVIGNWFIEKIMPGAFDDCLQDDIRCLFNHDPNFVLGRSVNGKGSLEVWVDDIGLKYRYTTPDRSYAKDLQNAIENGDVSQSSFAFKTGEQRWIENGDELEIREIVKFEKLFDVSPVTFPAYEDTEVAKRSFDSYKKENDVPGADETASGQTIGLSVRKARLQLLTQKGF